MNYPDPVPGLVIRYSYLWREEHQQGREEGVKDRPCAIVLVSEQSQDGKVVLVLPLTHTQPRNPKDAIEIPAATKLRLGLDDNRSWIVLTEANRFVWPGPDLRPYKSGEETRVAFGQLPYAFFEQVRIAFLAAIKARRAQSVTRTS